MTLTIKASLIEEIEPFVAQGFSLHWLHPGQKKPIAEGWPSKPFANVDTLRRTYASGNNVGVRLGEQSKVSGGFLHLIDLDIRRMADAPAAWSELRRLFPRVDFDALPSVASGSGGASRHLYFLSARPFSSIKLGRSKGGEEVWDPRLGKAVKKDHWQIELFGGPKQAVMPPSIHPDTGLPYVWERRPDFDSFEPIPFISVEEIEHAGAIVAGRDMEYGRSTERLGISVDEAKQILARLPFAEWCDERGGDAGDSGWVKVGMALKHEFGDDGYPLWCDFSEQSTKYDPREQRSVWKSLKGRPAVPFRMVSLRTAADRAVLDEDLDDLEPKIENSVDEFDALLNGTLPAPNDDEAVFSIGLSDELDWKSLLAITERGEIKADLHNLQLILANDIRTAGVMALNEFSQEVVQRAIPGIRAPSARARTKPTIQLSGPIWRLRDNKNGDFWSEDKDDAIRAMIEAPKTQGGYSIKVSDRDLRSAVTIVARKNCFHPVREYLSGLQWDGVKRAERLFVDYLGAPDDAYTLSVGRLMLIAAVARVFEPGCKFDSAVILQGLQGKRKSTFISTLAKSWFAELEGDIHDGRMMVEAMQKAWILEMPELGGFVRSDVRHVKAFVSRQSDKVRLAYAKRAREYPRQSIFIGSTNDAKYLKDDTGNRRFWPIACAVDSIDTDRLAVEVDQIWAEALTLYQAMRARQQHGTLPLYLTDAAAQQIAEQLQEAARVESADDALAGQITAWLEQPVTSGSVDDDLDADGKPTMRNETCLIEIWVDCLGNDRRSYNQQNAQMLGRAMRLVPGWRDAGQKRRWKTWGQQRFYWRPVEPVNGTDVI